MAKLQPSVFGPLPVRAINQAVGLELDEGEVVMSVNAQRHARRRHPADYARCFPHVAVIVTTPLYVRDDFKNEGKVELVGKSPGLPDWLLVAVEVSLEMTVATTSLRSIRSRIRKFRTAARAAIIAAPYCSNNKGPPACARGPLEFEALAGMPTPGSLHPFGLLYRLAAA